MPISRKKIAKTTAFQANCGVNALVHILVKNIKNDAIPQGSLELLCKTFNAYYKTNLTADEFKQTIGKVHNPVHLEVVLGPVLRIMLGGDIVVGEEIAKENRNKKADQPGYWLEHIDIARLANFFGIWVEAYTEVPLTYRAKDKLAERGIKNPTKEQIEEQTSLLRGDAIEDESYEKDILVENPGFSLIDQTQRIQEVVNTILREDARVLKLWNPRGKHFWYEESSIDATIVHDKYYKNRYPYHQDEAEFVKQKIGRSILRLGGKERDVDFSRILTEYENEQGREPDSRSEKAKKVKPTGDFFSVFGDTGFSTSIGRKMYKAFANPFVDASGELESASFDLSPDDGFMGALSKCFRFFFKIADMMKGVVSVFNNDFVPMFEEPVRGGTTVDPSLVRAFEDVSGKWEAWSRDKSASKKEHSGHKPKAATSVPFPSSGFRSDVTSDDEDSSALPVENGKKTVYRDRMGRIRAEVEDVT